MCIWTWQTEIAIFGKSNFDQIAILQHLAGENTGGEEVDGDKDAGDCEDQVNQLINYIN